VPAGQICGCQFILGNQNLDGCRIAPAGEAASAEPQQHGGAASLTTSDQQIQSDQIASFLDSELDVCASLKVTPAAV
jgi:hypothetical protein